MGSQCHAVTPALIGLALLVLAGCGGSPPTQHYVLAPVVANAEPAGSLAGASTIGLEAIALPGYLDRPQLVRRTGLHRIDGAEFHRWAEPLSEHLTRIAAENLSVLLDTESVYILPRRRTPDLTYRLEIDIRQFESDSAGQVTMAARWRLYRGRADEPIQARRFRFSVAVPPATEGERPDPEQIVAAMSQAVEAMCRDIAAGITANAG